MVILWACLCKFTYKYCTMVSEEWLTSLSIAWYINNLDIAVCILSKWWFALGYELTWFQCSIIWYDNCILWLYISLMLQPCIFLLILALTHAIIREKLTTYKLCALTAQNIWLYLWWHINTCKSNSVSKEVVSTLHIKSTYSRYSI